jgi:hypothetical protein
VLFSTDTSNSFLFVSASAGWDGSVVPLAAGEVAYSAANFPVTATRDTSNVGVVVMMRGSTTNAFSFLQFIRCKTPIPLGIAGPTIATTGRTLAQTILAVRDRIPTTNSSMALSYPAVVLYRFNTTLNRFVEYATIDTRVNYRGKMYHYREEDLFGVGMAFTFTFDKDYTLIPINLTVPETKETKLGAAIKETVGTDIRYTLCIASPREAEGVYVYEGCLPTTKSESGGMWTSSAASSSSPSNSSSVSSNSIRPASSNPSSLSSSPSVASSSSAPAQTAPLVFSSTNNTENWQLSQMLLNNYNPFRSFFGGEQVVTPNGRFLIVADSITKTGRGVVHLYHRRATFEELYGYEQVVRVNATTTTKSGEGINSSGKSVFDRVGMLVKGPDRNFAGAANQFWADQFGVGLAANNHFAVVGAPVEGCFYAFALPPACKTLFRLWWLTAHILS